MQMRINGTGMEVLSVQFPNGVQGAIVTNDTEPPLPREVTDKDAELAEVLHDLWPLKLLAPSAALNFAVALSEKFYLRPIKAAAVKIEPVAEDE